SLCAIGVPLRQFKFVAVGKLAAKEHNGPPRNTWSTRKHRRDADWCDRDGSRSPSLCALGVPLRQFKFAAVGKLAARERKEHKGPPRNTRSTRKHRRDADWCDRDGSRSPSLCAIGVPLRQFKFVAVGKLAAKEHKGPPRNTWSTRKHRRDADWCDRDGSRSPSLCALGVPLRQFKFVAVRKLAARERREHSRVRDFPLPSTGRGIEGEGWFGLRPLERDVCAHVRSHPSPRPSRAVLLAASPRSAVS